MQAIIKPCTALCGRTRTITIQDSDVDSSGPYLCAIDAAPAREAAEAQRKLDARAAEIAALKVELGVDDAALNAKIAAEVERQRRS